MLSCDVSLDVMVQVKSYELEELASKEEELKVTAQVFSGGYALHVVLQSTTSSTSFKKRVYWNQWLTLPVRYCDLQLDACVVLNVESVSKGHLGRGVVSLFDSLGRLRRGRMQVELDGPETDTSKLWRIGEKYNHDELPKIPWLDELARTRTKEITLSRGSAENMLAVEFPYFDFPVIFEERPYFLERPNEPGFYDPEIVYGGRPWLLDAKEMVNPVEDKYIKLNPSMVRGVVDRDLKPNREEKDRIQQIISSSGKLSRKNQEMLWKFCFSLTTDKRALVKFVMSVDWENPREVHQAAELLDGWVEIDIADALRLLGGEPEFRNQVVRAHAISILDKASNEELELYLLQLVQALRYDDLDLKDASAAAELEAAASPKNAAPVSPSRSIGLLAGFLIRRAVTSQSLLSFFSWYLLTERHRDNDVLFTHVNEELLRQLRAAPNGEILAKDLKEQAKFVDQFVKMSKEGRGRAITRQNYLQRMLKQKDGRYKDLCEMKIPVMHPLFPSQRIVGVHPDSLKVFSSKTQPIKIDLILENSNREGTQEEGKKETDTTSSVMFKIGDDLRQDQLVIQLLGVMDKMFKDVNLDLNLVLYRVLPFSKDEGMMEYVKDSFPLTVVQRSYGSIGNFFRKKAHEIHNSELAERKRLEAAEDAKRQEVGDQQGQRQQVDESKFHLRRLRSAVEIFEEMQSTFIKSCAGYCMCTYVLCVGDRHLDNILVRGDTGALFHIDFGFIMGHDPRSWAVGPIRLTRDMVETMGGKSSEGFEKFVSHCCQAYRILRNNANLILNLLHLMKDSKVNSVFEDHDAVLAIVRGRLELDRSDEQAEIWLREKIQRSEDTLITSLADALHNANTFLN